MTASDSVAGGGEMGELTRRLDWSRTAVGRPESWPQSLRTTVSMLLRSRFPMFLWWGQEHVQFYNDAYRPSLGGERHPSALGQRGKECWAEIWPVIGPLVEHVRTTGEATWAEDQLIPITRDGFLQEVYWTFSYSPIIDESGGVAGVLVVTSETTGRVEREREMGTLRDLAAQAAQAKDEGAAWRTAVEVLSTNPADVPFAFAYVLDGDPTIARLASSTNGGPSPLAPDAIRLDDDIDAWPLRRVAETGKIELVRDVRQRFGDFSGPSFPEPVRSAFILPITRPGAAQPYGFLVAGASPRRPVDDSYRGFFDLVADQIALAIANARAYEDERKRADALVEIDRAKTDFFSNVSHEFRTPLTLMLGPLEDVLADADPLAPRQRERLELVNKNTLRLLKLVNTLLDFSRIEAGRVQASYEATDIPALTRELVSNFASIAESAGIALIVDADPLPEPVWVDREMWEKIVLNLVSNAIKHTFEGSIAVRVRWLGDHAELSVSDTGTGIPESELPKLFERFHRVKGAPARTIEGSGIGLALVQELVKLHGGAIHVESQLGRGSTFTVSVPTGNSHLPQDRLTTARDTASTARRADAFVHEASGWVARSTTDARRARGTIGRPRTRGARAHVLLADDNADLRDYVRRLLEEHYAVEAVADGFAALDAARARVPDLVLSDVMMPKLDGFGLIAALHADPKTAAVPVILLSARAGEEATLEGLQAGAIDYLVKPFAARELAARVEGALRTAKARLEAQRERSRLEAVLAALHEGVLFQDASGIARYCNAACERVLGLDLEQLVGRRPRDPRWQAIWEDGSPAPDAEHALAVALRTGLPVVGQVLGVHRPDGTDVWLHVNAQPVFEADGTHAGAASSFFDITAEVRRAHEAHERAEFEKQLLGIVSHDLRNPLTAVLLGGEALLQSPALNERARKIVTRMQSSAQRSLRLVRDLLDFTQARLGGGIPITRQPLDLRSCMQPVVDELRAAFPGREIVLRTEGDATGDWDGDRLAQVAHNLVTNALKYGRDGAPVLVTIRGANEREVLLEVHNEGDPISPALVPELFKPLARGPGEAERKSRSIGLGLFIVDQLVRAHEGTIAVRSTEREGTTFAVCLPRAARGELRSRIAHREEHVSFG